VAPPAAVVPKLRALPARSRIILDLCAGSGAWSEPYVRAGYDVRRVDLPLDVRVLPLEQVLPELACWGVLAAPPCTEFSLAKNGQPRDLERGMACVSACMRLILQARPRWWALENPTGLLGTFLGRARDVFDPCDFGEPYTKRTALWGDFALPRRGPWVAPVRRWCPRRDGARTPAGFARAFFEANP
jgi:hypothetical protein